MNARPCTGRPNKKDAGRIFETARHRDLRKIFLS